MQGSKVPTLKVGRPARLLFALLLLLPMLALGQEKSLPSVKSFGAVCDDATDDTAAFQRAMNAGSFHVPAAAVCYVAGHVNGVSNRVVVGPGKINRKMAYGAGNQAVFYLDGIKNFTVDGVIFLSGQLADREAAVYLLDTGAPCSDITVKNSRFENIKGITTRDNPVHYGGVYPSAYYDSAASQHTRIKFNDNTLINLTSGSDTHGFAAYLWFCRDVEIARNVIKGLYGVAYLRGGDPANPKWTVNRQNAANHIVRGNVSTVQGNGVVLIGVKNAVVADNKFTAGPASGEILDSEGGRDITFSNNNIVGGQTPFNTFLTNLNVVFERNFARTAVYGGGSAGNGLYRASTGASDPDFANSGKIVFKNNTMISDVANAWVGPGWCNEFVFENNRLTNVTFHSNSGTRILTVRGNSFDFTVNPTFKNVIQVGAANSKKWNAGQSGSAPEISISKNTINGRAAGINVGALYIFAFTQAGRIDVFDNRFDVGGGTAIVLETGGGVAREIVIRNNYIRNDGGTLPFWADAPIANDTLTWLDNVRFDGHDTMKAITGPSVTPLTVDAKAITADKSRIWDGVPGSAKKGWVFDRSAGGEWRPFGA